MDSRYHEGWPPERQFDLTTDRVNWCKLALYLNDDYKGGEIVFGDRVIETQKGSGVLFDMDLKHSVNVVCGSKYTVGIRVVYERANMQNTI